MNANQALFLDCFDPNPIDTAKASMLKAIARITASSVGSTQMNIRHKWPHGTVGMHYSGLKQSKSYVPDPVFIHLLSSIFYVHRGATISHFDVEQLSRSNQIA